MKDKLKVYLIDGTILETTLDNEEYIHFEMLMSSKSLMKLANPIICMGNKWINVKNIMWFELEK